MSYQPFYIAGLKSGLVKNPKAFLIPEDAFPFLENAYIWRDDIKRKLGYSLLGRLNRTLTAVSLGNSAADPWTFNIITVLGLESTADIFPGTVTIVAGANTYTEPTPADGTLSGAPGGSGTIDYATGDVTLSGMGVGVATTITMRYAPALPVMGIANRELSSINLEELIVFDTVYAYRFNTGSDIFEEWIAGTTWNGTNSDFFWSTTYWQDDSQRDLLWATNFNATGGTPDPIRYSNGITWTDFAPATGAVCVDDENLGTITTPWAAFGPASVSFTPVKEESVVVTVGNPGAEVITVLTDDGAGVLSTTTSGRSDTGTINYGTGAITLTINPVLTADAEVHVEYCYLGEFLQQALVLIPYKDRLLAFNTYEGATLGTAVHYPQRLRFSQNGDPTDTFDGWRSDIPGRGGFIDAPTAEHIVGVAFIRDILIVSCERSTWQIRYTGNEVLPFVWEKIDTEYGCESTFSMVQFDKGVIQVGRDALTVTNGNSVERIDLQIPDEIGSFVSTNNGNKRVHGIRDLNIQLVYWTYSESPEYAFDDGGGDRTKVFPDHLLVYNYLTNSFSIWKDGFTALGRFYRDRLLRWQDLTIPWQSWDHPWSWAFRQQNFPEVIGGNQQGYVSIFNQQTYNGISLYISSITGTTTTTIGTNDPNIEDGDFVRLRNIIGDATNEALNDVIYRVTNVNKDGFEIQMWDGTNFVDVTPGSSYVGGGEIEVCNNFRIQSKHFNIFEAGSRNMVGYIDFLNEATSGGEYTCQIFVDENDSEAINTGSFSQGTDASNFVNSIVPTNTPQFSIENAARYWHRFYCQTDGATIAYQLTLSDVQMVNSLIYESPVNINALIVWLAPGGRLIP